MGRFQEETICKQCGKVFLRYGPKHMFCSPRCNWTYRNAMRKKSNPPKRTIEFIENPNPMAPWMRPLICLYFLEGESVKEIAGMTKRPQTQIRKVLADKKEMERAGEMLLFRKDNGFSYGLKELV